APKARKHLSADALFRVVPAGCDHIPDDRPAGVDIALSDVLMSAFAMFSLKAPSLLAFDKERAEDHVHTIYLKGARELYRSLDLMKKQCFVGSTQLSNRCLLRQHILHLPAAYPRIDLASLIQTDPPRFWITGRLSSVYHR